MKIHTIFYVRDQKRSREFYRKVLGKEPSLDVPGMTEFSLSEIFTFGLMPVDNIEKLLGQQVAPENDFIKAELYIRLPNPEEKLDRAISLGAKLLSPMSDRNWGDRAGYVSDFDGNVIAFASEQ